MGGAAFVLVLSASAAAERSVPAALGAHRLPPRTSLAGRPVRGGGVFVQRQRRGPEGRK